MPYESVGAIIALVRRAIVRAIAVGAVLSAPLFITPCGSSVPVGSSTVLTLDGTVSLNSIQLMRSISRVETKSVWADRHVVPSRTTMHKIIRGIGILSGKTEN